MAFSITTVNIKLVNHLLLMCVFYFTRNELLCTLLKIYCSYHIVFMAKVWNEFDLYITLVSQKRLFCMGNISSPKYMARLVKKNHWPVLERKSKKSCDHLYMYLNKKVCFVMQHCYKNLNKCFRNCLSPFFYMLIGTRRFVSK